MSIPVRFVLSTGLLALPLLAQERTEPRFRVAMGLGGGDLEHTTDGTNLDDETGANAFRLQFEGTSARGIGGGLRLESIVSDDDLFTGAGFNATEAGWGSFYGHFTYRLEQRRFAMPLRAGLLLTSYSLEDQTNGQSIDWAMAGPYLEVAPEFTLLQRDRFAWSLFGEVGFGFSGVAIDVDGDSRDYDSTAGHFGLELGTRFYIGPVELGLSYYARYLSVDESDPEGGQVVLGMDSEAQGAMFTVGVVF